MDKHYAMTIFGGLILGACIAAVGIYMFYSGTLFVMNQESNQPASHPPITSYPIPNSLGNGTTIDFGIYIVNASDDTRAGEYTEQDLTDAGFSIIDVEESLQKQEDSTLQFKKSREKEATLLENWADGDWGTLIMSSDLEETHAYDAILTIGTYQ